MLTLSGRVRDTGDFMGVAGVERLHEMGKDVGLSPPFANRTHMAGDSYTDLPAFTPMQIYLPLLLQ